MPTTLKYSQMIQELQFFVLYLKLFFNRSYYKGHKDKIKEEGRGGGGRWDWLGWGGGKGKNAHNCN